MIFDFLVVGTGPTGAAFARTVVDAGKTCLVIDSRKVVGGNIATETQNGVVVHLYGPHIFHTNHRQTWDYVNRFATFNHYRHHVKSWAEGELFSVPISLMTMYQLWGTITPRASIERLALDIHSSVKKSSAYEGTVEGWCLRNIGGELYEKLIRGYTMKQWGRHPNTLPASIIKRLPVFYDYREGYFQDRYQGVPVEGYSHMIENMLKGIPCDLGIDFLTHREQITPMARKIIYTGPIDALFNCIHGPLPYRSLNFSHQWHTANDMQGMAQLNWADFGVPHTRTIEHKHFDPDIGASGTVISTETPVDYIAGQSEPYYPINDEDNNALANRYKTMARDEGITPLGRLGMYQYMDMSPAIEAAQLAAHKELHDSH